MGSYILLLTNCKKKSNILLTKQLICEYYELAYPNLA